MGGGRQYKKSKNLENFLKNPPIHPKLFHKFHFKNFKSFQNSRGAILIEFAFSIPVLMALIYYAHDVPKAKRYYANMRFVSEQMVSMIQNVSQNRSDKKITIEDLVNIGGAAYLTAQGTDSFNYVKTTCLTAYLIYYVKGEANNKASVIWDVYFETYNPRSQKGVYRAVNNSKKHEFIVKAKKNANPSEIHPNLKIKEGEMKIILECSLLLRDKNIDPRKAFDFLILSPKFYKLTTEVHRYFFTSVIIFTPRTGLFDETTPTGVANNRY